MTTATLIKKIFNCGGLLTVSEVFIIIMVGYVQADMVLKRELRVLRS